jgi:tetratricopeptide (TPR) repeat protein
LRDRGCLEESEKILRETLALSSTAFGEEDALTLSTLHQLGVTLEHQEKFAQAQVIYRQVLAGKRKVFGDDHPVTAVSMNNLSASLRRGNTEPAKLAEAEQLQRKALSLAVQEAGAESRFTLMQKSALADTLRAQLKYTESIHMHQEALASKEKVLGKDDPATISSVFSLASLAFDQMQYEEALPLFERAYTWYMDRYGAEHPMTKTCTTELAWIRRVMEEDRVAAAEKAKMRDLGLDAAEVSQDVSKAGRKDSMKFNGWRRRLQDMVKKP